jgi:hypothetical protein
VFANNNNTSSDFEITSSDDLPFWGKK